MRLVHFGILSLALLQITAAAMANHRKASGPSTLNKCEHKQRFSRGVDYMRIS